jgi:uncharacterized membrane protein
MSNQPAKKKLPGLPGNERINAFSDGVFAIVITLLVLEIKVPELAVEVAEAELPRALLELWPKVFSHVISFVVMGIYWVGHHNMFMHIKRHDRVLLWLNIMFLLFVASMPFPTGLLSRYPGQQIALVIYCIVLILAGLSLDAMWWYASKNRRLVDPSIDPDLVVFVHRRVLIAPIIYLIAIGVSFLSVLMAELLLIVVAVLYILPNPLDVYHHKNLGEQD